MSCWSLDSDFPTVSKVPSHFALTSNKLMRAEIRQHAPATEKHAQYLWKLIVKKNMLGTNTFLLGHRAEQGWRALLSIINCHYHHQHFFSFVPHYWPDSWLHHLHSDRESGSLWRRMLHFPLPHKNCLNFHPWKLRQYFNWAGKFSWCWSSRSNPLLHARAERVLSTMVLIKA